jgi:hypothetical protein
MLILVGALQGQSSPTSGAPPSAPHDSRFTYGTIGGAADLGGGSSMQALAVLLQYKPTPWLVVSTNPTLVHATAPSTTGVTASSTGLTDLPFGGTVSHSFSDAPLSPEAAAGLEVTLPVGNAAQGLGSGQTGFAGDFGLGVSPTDNLSLDLNVWHPFVGAGINSMLDASAATSIGIEAGYDWTERFSTSVGFNGDVGRADSGSTLPQSIAAGFVLRFAKPLALTVDAAHGVTTGAPRWLVSVGVGTAFSGLDPLGANSLLARLRHAFGSSVNRGKGHTKIGGTCKAGSC